MDTELTRGSVSGDRNHLPAPFRLLGPWSEAADRIFTDHTLDLLCRLVRAFGPMRQRLLKAREQRQAAFDSGDYPAFLPDTQAIRAGDWKAASPHGELLDRRVELICQPRKEAILAGLNSGARVCIADFEDFASPTWANIIEGHISTIDAARRTLSIERPEGLVVIAERPAALAIRPRCLHAVEKHVLLDDSPVPAALFDFAVHLSHCALDLLKRGAIPHIYIAKLESHLEARLWREMIRFSEDALGLPPGAIRASVIIETVQAAMEMDEILYELRDHACALVFGRWDYVASFLHVFCANNEVVLPERSALHAMLPFVRSAQLGLVWAAHRRGVHAIGATSAQVPVRGQSQATEQAKDTVFGEKDREAEDGFDGCWVAHPGLVRVATDAFASRLPGPNQIHRQREDARPSRSIMLLAPTGPVTEEGIRKEIRVALLYLAAWFTGDGMVRVDDTLENAATVEISRCQLWRWLNAGTPLLDERRFNRELFVQWLDEVASQIRKEPSSDLRELPKAQEFLQSLVLSPSFPTHWTLPGYDFLEG